MRPFRSIAHSAVRTLLRVVFDRRGATAVEYALMLAFVVLALVVGLTRMADSTIRMWNNVDSKVAAAH